MEGGKSRELVIVHGLPRALNCPNISPFVIKLETFLRMVKVDYVLDIEKPLGKNGKTPWVTFRIEDQIDSQLSIEKITKDLDLDFEKNLTPGQKSISHIFRVATEERFYFCLMLNRYVHEESPNFSSFYPPIPGNPEYHANFRKSIERSAHSNGIGKKSRQEIEKIGLQILANLSTVLGKKKYFLGETPCVLDCSVFGTICSVLHMTNDKNVYHRAILKQFLNLKEHNDRMREDFWPDWEKCKSKRLKKQYSKILERQSSRTKLY